MEEKQIKIGLEVSEALHRKFKMATVSRGVSMKTALAAALESWLQPDQPAAAPSTAGQGTPASEPELANAITGLVRAWREQGPLWRTLSATLAEKAQQGPAHEETASQSHSHQRGAQPQTSHPKRAKSA